MLLDHHTGLSWIICQQSSTWSLFSTCYLLLICILWLFQWLLRYILCRNVYSSDYKAIFYAGGHGPMFDLPDNQDIAKLAVSIYENGGIVSAVCHGPVGMYSFKFCFYW